MPISQGDLLFALTQSLTKAEKRNFTLYVRRIQIDGDVRFFQLFEVLDRQAEYDEAAAMTRLGEDSKSKFSNLKRHLYEHLMTSLRLMHIHKQVDIQIRELTDYAYILYGRGLYIQALKVLNKAKHLAKSHNQDILHLEIVEFEKRIESRHITRSDTARIEALQVEAQRRTLVNSRIVQLSNLKLQIQRLFINGGYMTGPDDERLAQVGGYDGLLEAIEGEELTFFEKIYFCKCRYWWHYIRLEMEDCHRYARAWAGLYGETPLMIAEDVDLYMMALHHVLTSSFFLRDQATFDGALAELEAFREEHYKQFNPNSQIFSFLYVHQARYNQCFLRGDFAKAVELVPRTLRRIRRYGNRLDRHKVQIFRYKMAWAFMGHGQPGKAVDQLLHIINDTGALREDIQIYSRLMFMMAHYDLGNHDLLDSLSLSAARFLEGVRDAHPIPRAAVRFFRQLARLDAYQARARCAEFAAELQPLRDQIAHRRAFTFLDLPSWLRDKAG